MSTSGTAHPGYRFSESHHEDSTLNHALPTGHIDRLYFGIPDNPTEKQVWNSFVSLAMSAQCRGWSQVEFENEVTGRPCIRIRGQRRWVTHRLWAQLVERSRDPNKSLRKAWDQADLNLDDRNWRDREELAAAAVENAWAWQDRLAAATDDLEAETAMVMDYVVGQVEKRGITRVTCPAREVAAHAGVSRNTAWRRLQQLTERGLLIQYSKGWYAKPPKKVEGQPQRSRPSSRRAAIYSLPDLFEQIHSPPNGGT